MRQRLFDKLQRVRKKHLREKIVPDAEKRAAWVVLNGADEIEALESTGAQATDSAADASS